MLSFDSPEDLLNKAKSVTSKAPPDLKESIEPYFVSRYFVAVYEARHGEIPIQVWNEYRNALDHLFRHLVNPSNGSTQINSAHKHFIRAALDILKLHTHRTQDSINKIKDTYDTRVLELVDNGEFIIKLNKSTANAIDLFEFAKISDSELGDDHNKNSAVLKKYLTAAFAFEDIGREIKKKTHSIEKAKNQYSTIHDSGHKHSVFSGIIIHLISAAIGSLITIAYQYHQSISNFAISLFD